MWVVYVCEFVCVNIYIYNVYICIYYYARESNDEDDVFFLFVCSDYPSRVCSWSTCSIEYSSPVLPNRKKARQNFISLFLVFLSQTKIKNEGQEEKSAFIQSCAREE